METAAEHETKSRLVFLISLRDRKGGEWGIIIVRCPQRLGAILHGWSEDNLLRLRELHLPILIAIDIH